MIKPEVRTLDRQMDRQINGQTRQTKILENYYTSYEPDFVKFWAQNFQWKLQVEISRQTLDTFFHSHENTNFNQYYVHFQMIT